MFKLFRSIFSSVGKGIRKDPQIAKLVARHPKFFKWLRNRFDPKLKFGLYLSIGTLLSVFFLFVFFGIIQDIFANDPLALADLRITNLFALFRMPTTSRLMLYFTYLGQWQIVVLGTTLLSVILLLLGKKKYLLSLVCSVAAGQLFVTVLKNIVMRQRPALANAVIVEKSASFPSGHTFVVFSFYLLALYILWKLIKNKFTRVIFFFAGLALFILIPISRIYLGVHWTSDVLGSIFLGSAWLTAFITYLAIQNKFGQKGEKILAKPKMIKVLSAIFLIVWVSSTFIYYNAFSYEKVTASKTAVSTMTSINASDIPDNLFKNLPRTSEGLTGKVMEPINFIFIGSREQLDNTFKEAKWLATDKISISTTWKIAYSTLFDKPYKTAPGTPSFWDSRPNDFAFEKPTASVREREHIHIWITPFTVGGQPLWLGTAHFDKSVRLTTNFIPTHEIDPLIDNERDSLKQQLLSTGKVASFKELKIVEPTSGKNVAGSVFFTDGRAYLVILK